MNRRKDMTEDPAASNLVELITCDSLKAIALAPIQVWPVRGVLVEGGRKM